MYIKPKESSMDKNKKHVMEKPLAVAKEYRKGSTNDPNGSYTGVTGKFPAEEPVQDADDL
jgi:hypothetical protein